MCYTGKCPYENHIGSCVSDKPMCPENEPDIATYLCGCKVEGKPPPRVCPTHWAERAKLEFYMINVYRGYKEDDECA